MQKINKNILRVIDANFNRAKEAIRVCEDISRFIFNSKGLTQSFKAVRHNISENVKLLNIELKNLLAERDILKDVGKKNFSLEFRRKNVADIFFANIQRLKESIRVLEEFSKLMNKKAAVNFKKIRYKIYQFEKEAIKKISTLSNPR